MAKKMVVTGHLEIDAKLATLETRVQKKVARNALKKATKRLKGQAKRELDRQWDRDTGDLERSIKDGAMKRSRSHIGRWFGTKTTDRDDFGGFQLEYGTQHIQEGSFIRRPGYTEEPQIKSMVIQDIDRALAELEV